MGFVFKKPLSPTQLLQLELKKLGHKFKELWRNNLLITSSDIAAILSNSYISHGGDGEGETNGVPTDADVAAILSNSYTHKDYELDDYAPDSFITDEDIAAILGGTYSDVISEGGTKLTISDEEIAAILGGEYYPDEISGDTISESDIVDILADWED